MLKDSEFAILAEWESETFGDTLDEPAMENLEGAVERILEDRLAPVEEAHGTAILDRADLEDRARALACQWEAWDNYAAENYGERGWGREYGRAMLRALLDAEESA